MAQCVMFCTITWDENIDPTKQKVGRERDFDISFYDETKNC